MRLLNFLQKIKARREYNKQVKNTINLLSALSDAELKDIGISRGEIRRVASEL